MYVCLHRLADIYAQQHPRPPKRKREHSAERTLSPSKVNVAPAPNPRKSKAEPKPKKSKVDPQPNNSAIVLKYAPIDVARLTASSQGLKDESSKHTDKVGRQLHSHHQHLLHRYHKTRAHLADSSKPDLDRVLDTIAWASAEACLEPPEHSIDFLTYMATVAPLLCALAEEPDTVNLHQFDDILTPVTEEDLQTETEHVQKFYLRVYTREKDSAQEEFVSYLQRQPIDAGFATAAMAIHGMATIANQVLADVLHICGFKGAEFNVENVPSPRDSDNIRNLYIGTTGHTVYHRHASDMDTKPQSRVTHFLAGVDPNSVQLFEFKCLRIALKDRLDFRRRAILSDIERALVLCMLNPLNSAHGGFIPKYWPPLEIQEACQRVMLSLPAHLDGVRDPDLEEELKEQIDQEAELIQHMREEGHEVGPQITPAALVTIKDNLTDHLRLVNGSVVSTWILKDITREDFLGHITPGFFSDDMGRAMAMLWDRLHTITHYEEDLSNDSIRICMGPFVNVWRLILVHRYWGLMVFLLHLLLERMRPLLLVGFSAPVSHIFVHATMANLANDVTTHTLGPELLEEARLKGLMAPPNFHDFQSHMGSISIVSTGPKPEQISAFLPMVHPGREFYRPWLLGHHLRTNFLVTLKGLVAQRVFAHKAFKAPPGKDAASRRAFLEQARDDVEQRLEVEGLGTVLTGWTKELRDAETADAALRGKHVVNGILVKSDSGKPRCYTNRTNGSVARGEPHSAERRQQLDEFAAEAKKAKLNGLPTFTGPAGSTALDNIFAEWLLSRQKGVSLLWSANHHGRDKEAYDTVQRNKDQLAKWNKDTALAVRQARADKAGSFARSTFLQGIELVLPSIMRGTVLSFSDAIVVAICNECKEGVIRQDRNSKHCCTIEQGTNNGIKITFGTGKMETQFHDYTCLLYLHDFMDHSITPNYLNEHDPAQFGFYSSLAIDYLVDENNNRLSSLPAGIDISTVGEEVIWRTADTPPHVLLASAMDIAARTTAEHLDSIDNNRGSDRPRRMAGSIDAPSQDKLWDKKFADALTVAIHCNPRKVLVSHHNETHCLTYLIRSASSEKRHRYQHGCTKGTGKVDQSKYYFWTASSFIDLPYCVMRIAIYKAIIHDDEQYKRILMW